MGSANVDLTFRTPRLPVPGETLAGRSLQQCLGGKGANQAVVAARLGADVTFVAQVGNDGFGRAAVEAYQAEGIDTSYVQFDEEQPTGTAAILVDDDAENCIIVVAGANARLTPVHVQVARTAIENSKVLLSQLETPTQAAVEAFRIARAADVMTVLTPAPAENVTPELLELCDICVPNKTEIATIVGQPMESEQDLHRAAGILLGRGVRQVVVTMGKDGVWLFDQSDSSHIPPTQVDAVDTTGAGDAFTGGLAVGLANGLPLNEAAQRAGSVATLSVTRPGTQPSFPTSREVDEWLKPSRRRRTANQRAGDD